MVFLNSLNSENDDDYDNIKIMSTHDEKVKLVGEILSNDSSRKILNLLNDSNEMTINEIAQNTGLSLSLVTHHIKRMQSAQVIKVSRIGRSVKGHKMNYYSATNQSFLIVPSKEPVNSIRSSLKKFSKFFAIGMAGFVSWVTLNPDNNGGTEFQQNHGEGLEENYGLVVSDDKWSSASETRVDSDSSEIIIDNYSEDLNLEPVPQSEPEPVPNVASEPSHSGIEDFTSQLTDADSMITGSVTLDRTVYPDAYDTTSADSPELLIVSIIIPIAVVITGIILERIITRWYNNQKISKMN